ncbi:hypothetical protein L0N33_16455 [Roseburia faecis]|nr:hypothetical protein [Roseburia faecis]
MIEDLYSVEFTEIISRALSAAIPHIYRIKFHRDIYKDLDALGKAVGNGDEGSSHLDMFSLEMFENIAYIMAKHADPTIPDSLHLSRLGQKKFYFFLYIFYQTLTDF